MSDFGFRVIRALGLLATLAGISSAQRLDPVKWSFSAEPASVAPGSRVLGHLTATITPGWHLYGLATPPPSPASRIQLPENSIADKLTAYYPEPKRAFDGVFKIETQTYEEKVEFLLDMSVKGDTPAGTADLTALVRFNVCDATRCLPPRKYTATAPLKIDPSAPAQPVSILAGFLEFKPGAPTVAAVAPKTDTQQDIGPFMLLAFGAGLLAIFTPCVFPMIPITMSYFLNKRAVVFQAAVFCIGIVVLFSAIGLLTTTLLRPFVLVRLGSSPWVNGFISIVFLVFGLSLLGPFEITLPSSMLTKLDGASQRGGILGTLLMGLTFSLTSFACIGPFIGPLLAASAQSGGARPLIGMATFAAGLATPFFLLAVFPGFLKRLPRSGGWLPRGEVGVGFVVLAALLEAISAVDHDVQWDFLT